MSIIDPYAITEGSRVQVNVAGTIYTGESKITASPGAFLTSADVTLVADPVTLPAGSYLLVSGAPGPGEARVVPDASTMGQTINGTYDAGVGQRTPIPMTLWRGGGLWTINDTTGDLTITTTQVRTQSAHVPVSAKPNTLRIKVTHPLGVNVTVNLYQRDINTDYPALPNFSAGSSLLVSTRQTIECTVSGLSFPANDGQIWRVDLVTKGGANLLYTVHGNGYFIF
jgi:hypothetical protein